MRTMPLRGNTNEARVIDHASHRSMLLCGGAVLKILYVVVGRMLRCNTLPVESRYSRS